jgi:Fe-S cluster biogenesis protein NfuA
VETLRPRLRKQNVEVELLEASEATVRVRVTPAAHSCGSTTSTLRTSVEDAVYEAAPEVGSLVIEGLEEKSASGFVSLDTLVSSAVSIPSSNGHRIHQKAEG